MRVWVSILAKAIPGARRCHKNYIRNKMKTLKFIAKKETNVKKYRNKTGDQTS